MAVVLGCRTELTVLNRNLGSPEFFVMILETYFALSALMVH